MLKDRWEVQVYERGYGGMRNGLYVFVRGVMCSLIVTVSECDCCMEISCG